MRNDPTRRSFLAAGLAVPALEALPAAPNPAASKAPIRYRTLGKTGLNVTELGFGCESISDPSVVEAALDRGVNFFDTSRSYQSGNAETVLGRVLGARRKEVVLTSRSYGKDRQTIAADLDASLKALRTDYLDIWYLGNKDRPGDVSGEMLEFHTLARKQGKIRFRGLSTHRLHDMLPFVTAPGRFDVVMTPYNFPMGAQFDSDLKAMNDAGLGVVAMKVMAGRFWRTIRPSSRLPALKWALRKNWIHTTAVNMRDHEALAENMRVMAEPFTPQEEKLLGSQMGYISPLVCRMCGSCDGACPRGLPVSDLVRYVMYAEGYGDYRMGRSCFDALPESLRAVRCTDCSACAVRCPNGVHVRERAARAQQIFA
ncbi:MAG: aldo/keto reductase [Bryobacteraceae bacterium]|jgi:aryl-alcohol dehydrogenase-like predicted oxidoreductase